MARNRQKKNIKRELNNALYSQWEKGCGHEKHKDKNNHNSTDYIHANQTFRTYKKYCNHFADFCKEQGCDSMNEAWNLLPQWLIKLQNEGKSASTLKSYASGVVKAYERSYTEIDFDFPQKTRSEFVRSRNEAIRDKHFSEGKNEKIITFCKCTGLRRHELQAIHGTDIIRLDDEHLKVHVVSGKGGKERYVDVIGDTKEIKTILSLSHEADKGLVFSSIHSAMDVHHYRAVYTVRAYQSVARNNIKDIPSNERIYLRKDMKGCCLDRQAVLYASKQLGHGNNRTDVITSSYAYLIGTGAK